MRSVEEWIGKTDDAAIPPRVKVRVFERAGKLCQQCSRFMVGKDCPEYDHIVALVNGGEHREANLRILCSWCHKGKTAEDVAVKSKTYRMKAKHLGAHSRNSRPMPCGRDSPWKKKFGGEVVPR